MIEVSLSYLVLIFLGLMLGPIFGLWVLNDLRRQQRERAAFRNVYRCRLCAFEFEDASPRPFPLCPRCGTRNERRRPARL